MIHKTKKLLMISGTILVILFISSTINNSIFPMSIQTPKVLAAEDKEDEETAYLKFVSQTVNKSNNSKNSTIVQIPHAAKGAAIPAKGTWFRKYVTICIGLQMAPIMLCF